VFVYADPGGLKSHMKETSSEVTSSFVRDVHLIYAELFLGTPFVKLVNVVLVTF